MKEYLPLQTLQTFEQKLLDCKTQHSEKNLMGERWRTLEENYGKFIPTIMFNINNMKLKDPASYNLTQTITRLIITNTIKPNL